MAIQFVNDIVIFGGFRILTMEKNVVEITLQIHPFHFLAVPMEFQVTKPWLLEVVFSPV